MTHVGTLANWGHSELDPACRERRPEWPFSSIPHSQPRNRSSIPRKSPEKAGSGSLRGSGCSNISQGSSRSVGRSTPVWDQIHTTLRPTLRFH